MMTIIPLSPSLDVWIVEGRDISGPFKALAVAYPSAESLEDIDEMDGGVLVATKGNLLWFEAIWVYFDRDEAMRSSL